MANRPITLFTGTGTRAPVVCIADYMHCGLFPIRIHHNFILARFASFSFALIAFLVITSGSLFATDYIRHTAGYFWIPVKPEAHPITGAVASGLQVLPGSISITNGSNPSNGLGRKTYTQSFTISGTFGGSQQSYEQFSSTGTLTVVFDQNGDFQWWSSSGSFAVPPGGATVGTWIPINNGIAAHWATVTLPNGMSAGTNLNLTQFFGGYANWLVASNVFPSDTSFEFWLSGANWDAPNGLPINDAGELDINGGGSTGDNSGAGTVNNNTNNNTTVNQEAGTINTTINEGDTITNTYEGDTNTYNYNTYTGGGGASIEETDDMPSADQMKGFTPDVPHSTNLVPLSLPGGSGHPSPLSVSLSSVWYSGWGTAPQLTITHDEIPFREDVRSILLLIAYLTWLVGIWHLLTR